MYPAVVAGFDETKGYLSIKEYVFNLKSVSRTPQISKIEIFETIVKAKSY